MFHVPSSKNNRHNANDVIRSVTISVQDVFLTRNITVKGDRAQQVFALIIRSLPSLKTVPTIREPSAEMIKVMSSKQSLQICKFEKPGPLPKSLSKHFLRKIKFEEFNTFDPGHDLEWIKAGARCQSVTISGDTKSVVKTIPSSAAIQHIDIG